MTVWRTGSIEYSKPKVMGILNLTPDSFSDGGINTDPLSRAMRMIDEGADIIDIGGESTRPGFTPVSAEEEIRRILPTIKDIAGSFSVPISVDTMKPQVADAALNAGAHIINDVNGLRNEEMIKVVTDHGAAVVIMHMPADPSEVHGTRMSGNVVVQIKAFLNERTNAAMDAGISKDQLIIDPGIGFGKTLEQNALILKCTKEFTGGFPVLIGASRKRFLSDAFPNMSRDDASLEAVKVAIKGGASIVRVHDVMRTRKIIEQRNL